MKIDNQLPGGNVIVEKIDGHNAVLKRELRDTAGNWFYWKFRAEFDEPGDYVFKFLEGASIGNRGAAVSVDVLSIIRYQGDLCGPFFDTASAVCAAWS